MIRLEEVGDEIGDENNYGADDMSLLKGFTNNMSVASTRNNNDKKLPYRKNYRHYFLSV